MITENNIPLGFIKSKDIKDLQNKQYKERSIAPSGTGQPNYNRCCRFVYQDGELVHEIKIGEITEKAIRHTR